MIRAGFAFVLCASACAWGAEAPDARCAFVPALALPADAVVYASGAYAGRTLDVQIDRSGHAATQFDIAVDSPDRPVALILGAYDPAIWNLRWSEGTRIVAVFVTGYHAQALSGLPASTPTLVSTYDGQGACGHNLSLIHI